MYLIILAWVVGEKAWYSFNNLTNIARRLLFLILGGSFIPQLFSSVCNILFNHMHIIMGVCNLLIEVYCAYEFMSWNTLSFFFTTILRLFGSILIGLFYVYMDKYPQ